MTAEAPPPRPLALATLVLACALQVQVLLPVTRAYLQVSLADLLLPGFLGLFAVRLRAGHDDWPRWRWTWLPAAAAAAFAVLALALGWGFMRQGRLNSWALGSRFLGFPVLLGHLALGGWLATAGGGRLRRLFARQYLGFLAASALASLAVFAQATFAGPDPAASVRGLMANANAFAVVVLAGLALLPGLPSRAALLLAGLLLPTAWLTASRSLWLGIPAGAAVLGGLRRSARLLLLTLGIAVAFALATAALYRVGLPWNTRPVLVAKLDHLGTAMAERREVSGMALAAWRDHPILGGGLGLIVDAQARVRRRDLLVVHNTALWILGEMGLLGLAAFGLPYLRATAQLAWDGRRDPFAAGVAALLAAVGVMSSFQDLAYQRVLWVLAGLALARTRDAEVGEGEVPRSWTVAVGAAFLAIGLPLHLLQVSWPAPPPPTLEEESAAVARVARLGPEEAARLLHLRREGAAAAVRLSAAEGGCQARYLAAIRLAVPDEGEVAAALQCGEDARAAYRQRVAELYQAFVASLGPESRRRFREIAGNDPVAILHERFRRPPTRP